MLGPRLLRRPEIIRAKIKKKLRTKYRTLDDSPRDVAKSKPTHDFTHSRTTPSKLPQHYSQETQDCIGPTVHHSLSTDSAAAAMSESSRTSLSIPRTLEVYTSVKHIQPSMDVVFGFVLYDSQPSQHDANANPFMESKIANRHAFFENHGLCSAVHAELLVLRDAAYVARAKFLSDGHASFVSLYSESSAAVDTVNHHLELMRAQQVHCGRAVRNPTSLRGIKAPAEREVVAGVLRVERLFARHGCWLEILLADGTSMAHARARELADEPVLCWAANTVKERKEARKANAKRRSRELARRRYWAEMELDVRNRGVIWPKGELDDQNTRYPTMPSIEVLKREWARVRDEKNRVKKNARRLERNEQIEHSLAPDTHAGPSPRAPVGEDSEFVLVEMAQRALRISDEADDDNEIDDWVMLNVEGDS